MQGNWGNTLTGDRAAAGRYIEARLSKFALEVLYSPKITDWGVSYDGRRAEPNNLPVKFPLLLAQGAEGIAVGLATKIMPHNFVELIEASIDILKNKNVEIYPDFLTGGLIDVSNYNDGMRGGKIRVRAKIEELDKKTLIIKEIPFATTTTSLIESIIKANDAGKIKIKKVIESEVQDIVFGRLSKIDAAAAKAIAKVVRSASKEIAKKFVKAIAKDQKKESPAKSSPLKKKSSSPKSKKQVGKLKTASKKTVSTPRKGKK